jgi:uncharacterized membrane protein YesL
MDSINGKNRYVIHWRPTLLMIAGFFAFIFINVKLDGVVPAFVRVPLGLWVMWMVYFFNQRSPRRFLEFAVKTLVSFVACGLVWWLGGLLWRHL